MRLSRKLYAVSVLAAAALTVATLPASADRIGVLATDQVSGRTTGFDSQPYPTPGTALLDHFDFRFVNDDKHLQFLTVRPRGEGNNGAIDFEYADFNADDAYDYNIAHQRVSSAGLSLGTFTDTCRGQCTRNLAPPGANLVFVIRGFRFHYTGGDHHMDAIGIRHSGTQITHWFNDNNDDDEYEVEVDYAWVPRSRFSVVSTLSADLVHATGTARRTIEAGNKVIRGFFVDNIGSDGAGDNHIKGFGFLTNSTTVDIHYGDKDPADSADWRYRLDYGVLS